MFCELVNRILTGNIIGILKISVPLIAHPINTYFINYLMTVLELIHFLKETYAEKKIYIILINRVSVSFPTNGK